MLLQIMVVPTYRGAGHCQPHVCLHCRLQYWADCTMTYPCQATLHEFKVPWRQFKARFGLWCSWGLWHVNLQLDPISQPGLQCRLRHCPHCVSAQPGQAMCGLQRRYHRALVENSKCLGAASHSHGDPGSAHGARPAAECWGDDRDLCHPPGCNPGALEPAQGQAVPILLVNNEYWLLPGEVREHP